MPPNALCSCPQQSPSCALPLFPTESPSFTLQRSSDLSSLLDAHGTWLESLLPSLESTAHGDASIYINTYISSWTHHQQSRAHTCMMVFAPGPISHLSTRWIKAGLPRFKEKTPPPNQWYCGDTNLSKRQNANMVDLILILIRMVDSRKHEKTRRCFIYLLSVLIMFNTLLLPLTLRMV
jgi:hypothetical protein